MTAFVILMVNAFVSPALAQRLIDRAAARR